MFVELSEVIPQQVHLLPAVKELFTAPLEALGAGFQTLSRSLTEVLR